MQLETFPRSKPVTLASGKLFALAYGNTPPRTAETVFSTLYGWQEYFGYEYSCFEDLLVVHYVSGKELIVLPPLLITGGDSKRVERFPGLVEAVTALARAGGLEAVFSNFPLEYARRLPADRFTVIPERDFFEYVYTRTDLAGLPGRPFAQKRNLVRQFERSSPSFRYEALGAENLEKVRDFVRAHPRGATPAGGLAAGEGRMVERLLEAFSALKLIGGLLSVNGRVVAATLGAIVPDFRYGDERFSTAVVHYENALVEYKGAYQMINALFSRHLPESVVYVNREEDLGIAGLRKAKLSYNPVRFIEKCRILPRQK